MHDDSPQSQLKPLRNKAFKTKILENGNYFVQQNALIDAWLNGIISDYCYKLITILMRHSEDFQVKDSYLMPRFGNFRPNLKKAKDEAIMRNMIRIEKVRKGRSYVNHFVVLDPEFWILSTVENSTVENSTVENSTVEISTGIRRLSSKKKKNLNNNDVEKESAASFEKVKSWIPGKLPRDYVDDLADYGKIPTNRKNGRVVDIGRWNRLIERLWSGYTEQEIDEDITRLRNSPYKLSLDETNTFALIQSLKASEGNLSAQDEPQYISTSDMDLEELRRQKGGSLDDMPY